MISKAYYNENDPKVAAWLRQLIKEKLIAPGEVDERSITDVGPGDLKGFTQHHFFAGIGGWSYALRLAGWSDDKPVWTGSCPCQPFSAAGKNKGKTDDRHLWPHFFRLIRECRPDSVWGEQVEGAIKHKWLDDLQTDMEAEGYAVGHCVLGAHSVNAAHIRQRLYWVGHSKYKGYSANTLGRKVEASQVEGGVQQPERSSAGNEWVANNSGTGCQEQPSFTRVSYKTDGYESGKNTARSGRMGNTEYEQCEGRVSGFREELSQDSKWPASEPTRSVQTYCLGDTKYHGQPASKVNRGNAASILSSKERKNGSSEPKRASASKLISTERLGNAESERCGETGASVDRSEEWIAGSSIGMGNAQSDDKQWDRQSRESCEQQEQDRRPGIFDEVEWIYCRDGKYRPIKPGIKPLVNGLPKGMVYSGDPGESCNETQEARVMRLKGYGNAIVPQVAAEFIRAFR